jgi:hypothetical protein
MSEVVSDVARISARQAASGPKHREIPRKRPVGIVGRQNVQVRPPLACAGSLAQQRMFPDGVEKASA